MKDLYSFCYYNNDMSTCVESSIVAMFADDAKCYKHPVGKTGCEKEIIT